MKLYELANDFKFLEDNEDIEPDALRDTIESVMCEFKDKCVSVAAYFQNLDAEARAMKEAEQRISDRRKAIENRSNSLKEYLLSNMQRLEISEISCPEFSIKLRKPQQVVNVLNIDRLPLAYCRTIPASIQADKAKLKAALKAGEVIPGAELTDGKVNLIIK